MWGSAGLSRSGLPAPKGVRLGEARAKHEYGLSDAHLAALPSEVKNSFYYGQHHTYLVWGRQDLEACSKRVREEAALQEAALEAQHGGKEQLAKWRAEERSRAFQASKERQQREREEKAAKEQRARLAAEAAKKETDLKADVETMISLRVKLAKLPPPDETVPPEVGAVQADPRRA